MTEAATDTAPAPVADTAPDSTPATGTQDTQTTPEAPSGDRAPIQAETPNEFALPDEYKGKPWAEKIKSQEDAYKQIDNLTALVGKKTIQPIDFESASEEEITAYHKSLAPEKGAEAYTWGEASMAEITGPMGEIFLEAGINPHQQKLIAEKFDSVIGELAAGKVAVDTSEEGYLALMKESFGDDYEKSAGMVENALKTFAVSDEDKSALDIIDNTTRAVVDRTVHSIVTKYEDRIAAILKEHGVTESGAQTEGGGGSITGESKAEKRAAIRAEMRELDGTPHGHVKINELQKKLNSLLD